VGSHPTFAPSLLADCRVLDVFRDADGRESAEKVLVRRSKEPRKPKRFTEVPDSVVGPQGFEPEPMD
jgi:hypothetical protein